MIFGRLADTVLKHRRALIVAWVVVLLLSIPLMMRVNDVISYEENQYLGKSYESKVAGDVLEAQFPSTSSNSSIIMVVEGSDVVSPVARDFVLDLEQSIRSSSTVRHLDNVVSIYDVYATALETLVVYIAPLMHTLAEQTNLSYALAVASAESGIDDYDFLQSVFELGSAPSHDIVESLAWDVIRNGTVATYPISLPSGTSQSFINADNTTMLVLMILTVESAPSQMGGGGAEAAADVAAVRHIVSDVETRWNSGLTVLCTGDAAILTDRRELFREDLSLIGPATIALVLVLISLFFRSVLASFLPLGAIGIAVGLSQAMVFIVGSFVVDVSSTVLTMLFVVLFGVGTDYTVFLLARYREELGRGSTAENAMRTSITWAGESIATSGLAVIISVGALSFSSFSMMRSMGAVISVGIMIALLVALTLVPAIVMSRGGLLRPTSRKRERSTTTGLPLESDRHGNERYFRRAAGMSVSHPYIVLALVVFVSLPAGFVFVSSETSYDSISALPSMESIRGLKAISDDFGAGRVSPTFVLMQFSQGLFLPNGTFNDDLLRVVDETSSRLLEIGNVHELTSPTYVNGDRIPYDQLASLPQAERDGLTAQMRSMIGFDNRTAQIQLVFVEEPFTKTSIDTVKEIRSVLAQMKVSGDIPSDVVVLTGGPSASILDTSSINASEFRTMEILVCIAVFAVLLVVLGSVVLPLFTVLSILISITWILAATFLLFDGVLEKPVLFAVPMFLFLFLIGLGMDYNIFILTRIREEFSKSRDHEKSIIEAVDRTGGIITACALIMAGAFGTMMLSRTAILQEFGFAIAFGVLLDAMVVRTYVTPAIIKILGPRWTWWAPGRLQRTRYK